jgi:hypothetical protein
MITKRIQTISGAGVVAVKDDDGWDHIIIDADMTLNADDALQLSGEIDEADSWLWEQQEKKRKEKEAVKAQAEESAKANKPFWLKMLLGV